MPINPVCAVTCGRICAVSAVSSCSASGRTGSVMAGVRSCASGGPRRAHRGIEIILQYLLCRDLVDARLALARRDSGRGEAQLGGDGGQTFVDEFDRQPEARGDITRKFSRQTRRFVLGTVEMGGQP